MNETIEKQIAIVLRLLESKQRSLTNEVDQQFYLKCLEWYQRFPSGVDPSLKQALTDRICGCFSLQEIDIIKSIEAGGLPLRMNGAQPIVVSSAVGNEARLKAILPKGGWFEWYANYTAKTECPLSYHIFSSLCILGASLGRRLYKPMGFFNVYPNWCTVLIGPTGRVKKTSATDVARSFVHRAALCPIMADAITPESLSTALATNGGHQFIYAPEFSVLFGRQRYNEGLTTRIIRLLDCPEEFKISTQARGEEVIHNVALTILGASTLSLLAGSTPTEVTSSGFLNRFVLVVENDTERCFPEPEKGDASYEKLLLDTIERVKTFKGEMSFSTKGQEAYYDWYNRRKQLLRATPDDMVVEVLERTFVHTVRLAMLIHLAQCDSLWICDKCVQDAANMMSYLENAIPQTVRALKQTSSNADMEWVLSIVYRAGGAIDHSSLVRRTSSRMNVAQLKPILATLREGGRLKFTQRGTAQFYVLMGEPEKCQ